MQDKRDKSYERVMHDSKEECKNLSMVLVAGVAVVLRSFMIVTGNVTIAKREIVIHIIHH